MLSSWCTEAVLSMVLGESKEGEREGVKRERERGREGLIERRID